ALLLADEIARGVRTLELGPSALPTFDRVAVHLAAGTKWSCQRGTVNQIFTVIEGRGESLIEGQRYAWSAGDMMVVPSWYEQEHVAQEDAVLLRVSDEPVMRMLGWFRQSPRD
ncbi:MAG: hypothetical protein JWR21_2063, partial [Herminiimonas sp.]|nr:hypothetical protein [Herminiimonas sp.]